LEGSGSSAGYIADFLLGYWMMKGLTGSKEKKVEVD
jgi:hypothetical protein